MTLGELIARYRTDAHDKAQPYFVSDAELIAFLNEAESEAAIRGRLIHESSDRSMCQVKVTLGRSSYLLNAAMYELTHIAYKAEGARERCGLRLVSTEYLDATVRNWRDMESSPEYLVQTDKTLRLVPEPPSDGLLLIEGYRTPKVPMEDLGDEPEIAAHHHIHLVQWALHRAFSIPDTEFFDPSRAANAEDAFSRYFGLRPDSDLRRITRHDVPHHVEPFWP